MIPDVCGLVRRDHDDIDRALAAMVDPRTPVDELVMLLDVLRLALAVHVTAEARVFRTLLEKVPAPAALGLIVMHARDEHARQHDALDELGAVRVGGDAWYGLALELRVLVLDHASRAELIRWTLQDHVPLTSHRALAREYAIERMRVLARTSPVALARAQLLVG